jgi:hypothetical protein
MNSETRFCQVCDQPVKPPLRTLCSDGCARLLHSWHESARKTGTSIADYKATFNLKLAFLAATKGPHR